jgi:hypothetical protein
MKLVGGKTPDLVLRGGWRIVIVPRLLNVVPDRYYVHGDILSMQQWDDILTNRSTIDVEELHYRRIPNEPPSGTKDVNYLIYNSDRSATVDDPYFAQTGSIRKKSGALVFIRGKGRVPVEDGWVVLGNTYYEVWFDPTKRSLYLSFVPLGNDGFPQPFGFFAGAENEMLGPVGRTLFAATTRPATIIDFSWPQ